VKIGTKVTNPGELRTRVLVQTRVTTLDAGGFKTPTWTTVAEVWCRWQNAHGRELVEGFIAQVDAPASVLLRYRNDIDVSCSLLKGGVRWEIVSVDNIAERSEYLELKVVRMRAG
jgi:SPP1 family predicted phage head-tail adaptor